MHFTSLEVYPFLNVFPCSTIPSWATLPSIPSLDVTWAKVSFGTGSQARSNCRKQEIHSEREWKSYWKGMGHLLKGPKRPFYRENWGKKNRGRKRNVGPGTCWCQLTQQCCSLELYFASEINIFLSTTCLGFFFPPLFKDFMAIITPQYLAAVTLTCMHRLSLI